MEKTIREYLATKEFSWSESTKRTEASRLRAVYQYVDMEPSKVYTKLDENLSKYTLKTTFIRLGEFYAFLYPTAANPFKDFMQTHSRLFKHAYEREVLSTDYKTALEKIDGIKDANLKQLALFMLHTGTRSCEVLTYNGNGVVVGKGGKPRKLFLLANYSYPENHAISYSMLHKGLAKVGLKPHTLRKLYATKLVEAGMRSEDLLKIMGWNNVEVTKFYLQPKTDAVIIEQITGVFRDGK